MLVKNISRRVMCFDYDEIRPNEILFLPKQWHESPTIKSMIEEGELLLLNHPSQRTYNLSQE